MSAAEQLRALAGRVEAEQARPVAQRESGAEDAGLDAVRRLLLRAADRLDAADSVGARRDLDEVAYVVGDSWSTHARLGVEVLAAARSSRAR